MSEVSDDEQLVALGFSVDDASGRVKIILFATLDDFDWNKHDESSAKKRSSDIAVAGTEATLGAETNDDVPTWPELAYTPVSSQSDRSFPTVIPPKTEEEFKAATKKSWEQYVQDTLQHHELQEKVAGFLATVRQQRLALWKLLNRCQDKLEENETFRIASYDQLLQKANWLKTVVSKLESAVEARRRRLTALRDMMLPQPPCEERSSVEQLSKWPVPARLTEHAVPSFSRERRVYEENKPLQSIWDCAMKIEMAGESDISISWIPKEQQPKRSSAQSSSVITKSETLTAVKPSPAPMPRTATAVQSTEIPTTKDEPFKEDAVTALLNLELDMKAESQSSPAATRPVDTDPPTEPASVPLPLPTSTTGFASNETAPAQLSVSQPPRIPAQPPQRPQSTLFSIPVATNPPVKASSIAGGAAFGQAAFPRSHFSSVASSIVPQLGSLQSTGSTSPQLSTFAGMTGGFAAFAQSGQRSSSLNQPLPQSQLFGPRPPAAGSTGLTSSGFGTSGRSIFGSKPVADSEKLWEMRK